MLNIFFKEYLQASSPTQSDIWALGDPTGHQFPRLPYNAWPVSCIGPILMNRPMHDTLDSAWLLPGVQLYPLKLECQIW